MIWQYRTIVFEFAKDGLLGDRYLDDESMEKTLNEQGGMGWELVNVVMIQEGLLAVLKRSDKRSAPGAEQQAGQSQAPLSSGQKESPAPRVTAEAIGREELRHIQALEEQRRRAMQEQEQAQEEEQPEAQEEAPPEDQVGGIRIF
ncbi:hypothetical protein [Desulfogranum mediterraneum]|uniref:hypothetical protein n=1 Tax=Desulfogranum mediterraneum TaxID=160661 RepID=UPI000410D6F8|nr:hypothetical protein [Desulfogranum mediterraneum]